MAVLRQFMHRATQALGEGMTVGGGDDVIVVADEMARVRGMAAQGGVVKMAAVDVGVHIETADARQRRQTRAESRHQHDAAYGSGADGTQIMQQADGAKAVRDEQGVAVGRTDGLRQRRLPGGKIGMLAVG